MSNNGTNASASLTTTTAGRESQYLRTSSYGFSIPSDATIIGITVAVDRSASSNQVTDLELRLLKAGVLTGDNKADTAAAWPTSDGAVSYGGTSDLWGTTWTPAEINATAFGVSLRARNGHSSSSRTANVDGIAVSVTYVRPPNAAQSTIAVDKSSIPDDGSSLATITVQLKDASGVNTTATSGVVTLATNLGTLTASGGAPTGSTIVLSSAGGGTYTGTITSTSAGTATLTATLNAATIGTATLNVVEGPSAATSTVSANPASRPANGTSASTITVQLKNPSGGNISFSGGPVTLTTTRGTLTPVVNNNNGTYTSTLTSTSPGPATIRGYPGGVEMGMAATVTFDAIVSYDINYQTINLSGLTLLSGTALQVNAVYRKLGAITIDGQVIDARMTITGRSNVTTFTFDNDATNPGRFQPEINSSSSAGGYVDFSLSFYLSGTSTKVDVRNFFITAVDVDGDSTTVSEYIELKDFSSYLLDASTQITVGPGGRTGFTRFFGRSSSLSGIVFDNTAALIARYDIPLSDIEFRLGYTGSASSARQHSVEFGAVGGTFSNPNTLVPLITGPSGGAGSATSAKSIPENTTPVHTFSASRIVNWTLNGGADEAKFAIDPITGALSFVAAPDFENPTDADGNNTYIVVLRASDSLGMAADQTVTVTVTDVVAGDPSQYLVTSGDYAPMAGSEVTITAQLADANGNPVAIPKLTVTWSKSHGSGAFASVTSLTDADGKATVVLTTHTAAGTATTVTGATETITGTSATITTAAGSISVAGAGTELSGTDLTRIADGIEAATITLQLRDVNGSPISRAGVAVTFATTAGTLSATTTTTDSSGTASAALVSTAVGQADVTATVDDDDNAGTPQAAVAHGSPVKVVFTTGPVSVAANGSLLGGTDVARTADGTAAATLTVQLRDAQGHDIGEAGVEVTFSTSLGTLSSTGAVLTDPSGVATATLTSTITGSAHVTATIGGTGAVTNGSPVTVTFSAGAASPAHSTIAASPTTVTADGTSTSTITVQLTDAHGNNLTTSGGAVNLEATHGTLGSVTDNSDGTYTATLTSPAAAATATVTGTLVKSAIAGKATVDFTAGPISVAAAGSLLAGADLTRIADGTSASTLTVQLRDAHGNDISQAGVGVTFSTTRGTPSAASEVLTDASGMATVTLTSTAAGTAEVTASVVGSGLGAVTNGSPVTVSFSTGAISVAATGSLLGGTDLTRTADGASAATLTVQLRDAHGNDISQAGVEVAFATTRGTLSSTGAVTTNAGGLATITLTSTEAGSADVTASIAGSGLGAVANGSSVTVTFTAGAISVGAGGSLLSGIDLARVADGASAATLSVQLRDADGNDIHEAGVVVTFSTTRGTLSSSGEATTNSQPSRSPRQKRVRRT